MSKIISRNFSIPEFRWEAIKTHLPLLNEYAEKFNIEPFTYSEKTFLTEDHRTDISVPMVEVTLNLPEINMSQHTFVALLEHTKEGTNLVKLGDIDDIEKKLLHRPQCCEHCSTNRTRTNTIILRDKRTNEQIQLGTKCVVEYTSFASADSLVKYILTFSKVLDQIHSECTSPIDEDLLYSGGIKNSQIKTEMIIATALAVVEKMQGAYISRQKCGPGEIPTVELVSQQLLSKKPPLGSKLVYIPHLEKAREIINWFKEEPESTFNWSTYAYNLKKLVPNPQVTFHWLPMIASAFTVYEQQQARKNKKDSLHQGQPGEKIDRKLMITRSHKIHSQFGNRTVHLLKDVEGNTFKWETQSKLPVLHHVFYHVSANVKGHNNFNGFDQTEITHVKFPDVDLLDRITQDITPKKLNKILDSFHDFGVVRLSDRQGIIDILLGISNSPESLKTFLNHPNCHLKREQWYLILSSVHYYDEQFAKDKREIYDILHNYNFKLSPSDIDLVVTGQSATNVREVLKNFIDEEYFPLEKQKSHSSSMNP